MPPLSLRFDAVNEAEAGPKWSARWDRSWPAYEAWFIARGGDSGPSRADCEGALATFMPELVPLWRRLLRLAGGSDRAARFLSTWCPPAYLGGCSIAAASDADAVRLVRNYDLSPDLNEGLLLRSEWLGRPVMGMVEFLWGLSDGINGAGLSVALAYGGRQETAPGFGVTTILRYIMETCDTVPAAIKVLQRVPSHMAYNIVLADAAGHVASVQLSPGGGVTIMSSAVATNHQAGPTRSDRPEFTRTHARHDHLTDVLAKGVAPSDLSNVFLASPLHQTRFAEGFGTLFTAEYDPLARGMTLHWPDHRWSQTLSAFQERSHTAVYALLPQATAETSDPTKGFDWAALQPSSDGAWQDWVAFGLQQARSTDCGGRCVWNS